MRFAVRTEDHLWGWHRTATVPSASVLKAMLLVAYLDRPGVRGRPLTKADFRLIGPMIRRSDNAAATRVLGIVGPGGVYRVARAAGMRRFSLAPVIWGASRIDASDQTRFFLHVDRRVVARHRSTALHLLSSIVPSQRWGIGSLRFPGLAGLLQGRLGRRHGGGRPSGGAAPPRRGAAWRWPCSPRTARATTTASARCGACSPACCAASAKRGRCSPATLPLRHLHELVADLAPRAVLAHEAVDHRAHLVELGAVDAHQDEPRLELGVALAQQRAQRRAAQADHAHVEQGHVRPECFDDVESLVTAPRDGHQLKVAVPGDGACEAFPISTLVVGENDCKGSGHGQRDDGRVPAGRWYPLPV